MLNFQTRVGADGVDDHCYFLLPCPELAGFGDRR